MKEPMTVEEAKAGLLAFAAEREQKKRERSRQRAHAVTNAAAQATHWVAHNPVPTLITAGVAGLLLSRFRVVKMLALPLLALRSPMVQKLALAGWTAYSSRKAAKAGRKADRAQTKATRAESKAETAQEAAGANRNGRRARSPVLPVNT